MRVSTAANCWATQSAASDGNVAMQRVVDTMQAIEGASKRIGDITGVIDGIAFQTNILALNAAVEAARAGEQGRGFAVVASEVRVLAQRSAAAAQEIKKLIDEAGRQVGEGAQLVADAGQRMQGIVGGVENVSHLMHEISAASQEQSVGIEQINQTVVQMDRRGGGRREYPRKGRPAAVCMPATVHCIDVYDGRWWWVRTVGPHCSCRHPCSVGSCRPAAGTPPVCAPR